MLVLRVNSENVVACVYVYRENMSCNKIIRPTTELNGQKNY